MGQQQTKEQCSEKKETKISSFSSSSSNNNTTRVGTRTTKMMTTDTNDTNTTTTTMTTSIRNGDHAAAGGSRRDHNHNESIIIAINNNKKKKKNNQQQEHDNDDDDDDNNTNDSNSNNNNKKIHKDSTNHHHDNNDLLSEFIQHPTTNKKQQTTTSTTIATTTTQKVVMARNSSSSTNISNTDHTDISETTVNTTNGSSSSSSRSSNEEEEQDPLNDDDVNDNTDHHAVMSSTTDDDSISDKRKADQTEKNARRTGALGDTGSPTTGFSSSNNNNNINNNNTNKNNNKFLSLSERGRIPASFYITIGTVISLQYLGNIYSMDTIYGLYGSITTTIRTIYDMFKYIYDLFIIRLLSSLLLMKHDENQEGTSTTTTAALSYTTFFEVMKVCIIGILTLSIFYVFIIAPFKAGLWTGQRAKRHQFHRYMGLVFIIQYTFAWIELINNYHDNNNHGAAISFLPHTISVNGLLQGCSAYISFKVLPELQDAGYISDKAVLSRNFVHENIFFSLMTCFGSLYYHTSTRIAIRSTILGQILECIYVFWPYVLIRTWFPVTRFKHAGSNIQGRTNRNLSFYQISTTLVKLFFLWAKYFLGFYMNFLIFLNLPTEKNWYVLHGMLLLNIGTVSLAVFLHTLRFKKVLPPKLTFSIYLVQIYATFYAIPFAYDIFIPHMKLCILCFVGLLCNMTRNRTIHGCWCMISMILLTSTSIFDIQW